MTELEELEEELIITKVKLEEQLKEVKKRIKQVQRIKKSESFIKIKEL